MIEKTINVKVNWNESIKGHRHDSLYLLQSPIVEGGWDWL